VSGIGESSLGNYSDLVSGASLSFALAHYSPLRFELLPSTDGSVELGRSPFMVLSDYDGNSQVFVGRIVLGDNSVNRYVAIKMPSQPAVTAASIPEAATKEPTAAITHQTQERRWLRELNHYSALGGKSRGITPLFFNKDAGGAPDQDDESAQKAEAATGSWPPLLYYPDHQLLFPPLGECGTPLATCRDSALLAAHGHPSCESSTKSLLYSKEDVETGAAPVFYNFSNPTQPAGRGARKGKKRSSKTV
jgi:hypothetical protein